MTKFVTAGGLRIDYLITHTGEAHVGEVGGNALYSAVGASLWGDSVGLWVRIGANYPQAWLEKLAALGLDTAGVVRVAGEQEHRTFYAYTTKNGRRDDTNPAAHFARIGQPLPSALADYVHSTPGQNLPHDYGPLGLRPEDWPTAYEGVTAVHLAPIVLSTHLHTPQRLRQQGVRQICADPGERYMVPALEPYIRQLLPQLDAFLPSDMEVCSLFGEGVDLREAAQTLCSWGVPLVVIKNGANGVLVQEGENGRFTHIPAFHHANDPRIVDLTGAGDSFCGAFMVGLAQTGDPLRAAQMGIVTSSLVIEGYSALYALTPAARQEAQARLQLVLL